MSVCTCALSMSVLLTRPFLMIIYVSSPLYLVHIGASVLVELVAGGEDDKGYLAVAEDGQLVRLLHHTELALVEGHLHTIN